MITINKEKINRIREAFYCGFITHSEYINNCRHVIGLPPIKITNGEIFCSPPEFLFNSKFKESKGEKTMAIELGSKVKDKITGFMGIAVGRTVWLNGCVRVGVQKAKVEKDGKISDAIWIDEQQLKVVDRKNILHREPSGGPMPDPSAFPDPH